MEGAKATTSDGQSEGKQGVEGPAQIPRTRTESQQKLHDLKAEYALRYGGSIELRAGGLKPYPTAVLGVDYILRRATLTQSPLLLMRQEVESRFRVDRNLEKAPERAYYRMPILLREVTDDLYAYGTRLTGDSPDTLVVRCTASRNILVYVVGETRWAQELLMGTELDMDIQELWTPQPANAAPGVPQTPGGVSSVSQHQQRRRPGSEAASSTLSATGRAFVSRLVEKQTETLSRTIQDGQKQMMGMFLQAMSQMQQNQFAAIQSQQPPQQSSQQTQQGLAQPIGRTTPSLNTSQAQTDPVPEPREVKISLSRLENRPDRAPSVMPYDPMRIMWSDGLGFNPLAVDHKRPLSRTQEEGGQKPPIPLRAGSSRRRRSNRKWGDPRGLPT
jgi:hypothetical protein